MEKKLLLLTLVMLLSFSANSFGQGFLGKLTKVVVDAVVESKKAKTNTNRYTNAQSFTSSKNTKSASSSNGKEVTLTVTGSGKTKEDAVKSALRSALEQTYGAFVSSNTTIVDDELIKDEISTISNNCVKSYRELSSKTLPNGCFFVTLQTTVSISGLVSYAQSKGSSVEFSGSTFGMNMKIKELNKQNEQKAVLNMLVQLMTLGNLYDYELDVKDPQNGDRTHADAYVSKVTVYLHFNENTRAFNDLAYQVLSDLSLSDAEVQEYQQSNTPYYVNELPSPGSIDCRFAMRNNYAQLLGNIMETIVKTPILYNKTASLNCRTPDCIGYKDEGISAMLDYLMRRNAYCYKITDNLHDPTEAKVGYLSESIGRNDRLASPWLYWLYENKSDTGRTLSPSKIKKENRKNGTVVGYISFDMYIPKTDIDKYSNFEIKPVQDINLYKYLLGK